MIVALEEVFEALKKRRQINSQPLKNITWIWKGKKIKISKELIDDFEFTGMLNTDFAVCCLGDNYYEA